MADFRLKTLTIEPSQNLTIQHGKSIFSYTTPSVSTIDASVILHGGLSISHTTDATSHTSGGALTINGGIGVSEQAFFGNNITLETTSSTFEIAGSTTERLFVDTVTNQLIKFAPDGINTRFQLTNDHVSLTYTKSSTNASTGALVLLGGIAIHSNANTNSLGNGGSFTSNGGMSIAGRSFVGGDSFIQGTSNMAQLILGPATSFNDFNSSSQIRSISNTPTDSSSILEFHTHPTTTSSVGTLRMTIDHNGHTTFHTSTNATNTSTGSVIVHGGISTKTKSYFGEQLTIAAAYTNDTSAHLILENTGSDTPGTDRDTRLLLHSKSDGEASIVFQNTTNTTINNLELTQLTNGTNSNFSFRKNNNSLVNIYDTGILHVYGTEASTSATSGSLQVYGGLGVEKTSFFKSLAHFDSTIELKGNSQVYHILGGGDTPTGIAFTGKSGASASSFNFFTSDGDNTDNLSLKMFNLGTPNNVSNSESLEFVWDSGSTLYRISSNSLGTGILRGIYIESGSTNQFVIGTAGNISINGIETSAKLYVNGNTNIQNTLSIQSTNHSTSITTGAIQIRGGIGSGGDNYLTGNTLSRGTITIDNTNTESFLIRKNGDTGDVLTVDTTTHTLGHTFFNGDTHFHLRKPSSTESILSFANNDYLSYNQTSDTYNFYISSTSRFSINTTNIINTVPTIIDTTSSEALLVRKTGDTGDVFAVDTTNSTITINNTLHFVDTGTPLINMQSTGTGAPTFTTRSNGTKIVLFDQITGTQVDDAIGTESSTMWFSISEALSTRQFRWYAGTTKIMDLHGDGHLKIFGTNNATSNTAGGSLTVSGGTSIAQNLYVGNNTNATNLTTGAAIFTGGLVIQTTTDAVSLSNAGSLLVAGGASINKQLFLGTHLTSTGTVQMKGTSDPNFIQFYDSTNTQRWVIGKSAGHHLFFNRYNTSGILQETSLEINVTNGKITANNTTPSTSITDAAIIIHGGIAIGTTQNAVDKTNGGGLTIAGGLGVSKDTYIGGTTTLSHSVNSTDISTGTLIVSGGVGIHKNLHIGGDVIIQGNLTVSGTTTSISTTQTLVEDNITVYNSGPTGTADSGFLIERFQIANNSGTGDVVSDPPALSNTFPSQSGTISTTAILHTGASGVDDFYNNWWIKVTSGFSANQVRKIIDYNGTSKTITIETAWTTQNPANSDTFELYNKPLVGMIFNEVQNRFHFTGSTSDPGQSSVNFTDEIDLYTRNITLTGTKSSTSSSAGLFTSGGATFASTQDSTSITSGGSLTTGGGASIGKSLIVGQTLTVNGSSITPNTQDIFTQMSFTGANNQVSPANVTGLSFSNASTQAFDVYITVIVIATTNLYAHFHLRGIQKQSSWEMVSTFVGDSTGVTFTITSIGQIQYTSSNYTGFTSLTTKFRAFTITV